MALGSLGLSYDDFCALSPGEFHQVLRCWAERETEQLHGEWERARVLATVFVQPHLKKPIDKRKLLPLPWDKKVPKGAPSTEARRQRILKRTQEYYGIDNQHNLQAPGEPQGPQG
ncbi:MAG: hypothetical protein IKR87_02355, partial [Candidatus Methanomethylophilaceae archaeon]|nr:hypothetical protein [Candidatus Methanomethylophilaceae archaeon]